MTGLLLACPMCFGAADSEQVHAAKIGVLVLLGFIVPILAAIAFGILWAFGGDTHALIPLYSVGVFLCFTLSQLGMVKHWLSGRETGWR